MPSNKPGRIRRHRPEQGAFLIVADAGSLDVGEHGPGCVEENLSPLLGVISRKGNLRTPRLLTAGLITAGIYRHQPRANGASLDSDGRTVNGTEFLTTAFAPRPGRSLGPHSRVRASARETTGIAMVRCRATPVAGAPVV